MTIQELRDILAENPDRELTVLLPDSDEKVPAHFHITEVGHRKKTFVDCGGTHRVADTCSLQLWIYTDYDHRVNSSKLTKIISAGDDFLTDPNLQIEIEHQRESLTLFTLESVTPVGDQLVFQLGNIAAVCLAMDKCCPPDAIQTLPSIGISNNDSSCTPGSGCC